MRIGKGICNTPPDGFCQGAEGRAHSDAHNGADPMVAESRILDRDIVGVWIWEMRLGGMFGSFHCGGEGFHHSRVEGVQS